MSTSKKALSVTQVATFCGVRRNTVGYWIRSKTLRADRVGRAYSIAVEDLLYYLNSIGRKIPADLSDEDTRSASFRTFQPCWQYWNYTMPTETCKECIVFKNHRDVCFLLKDHCSSGLGKACIDCRYYQDIYLRRIGFIHQIDLPAAVYRDLFIWGGNRRFAQLCEVQEKDLIGMGIEQVVHPDSMETVIRNAKRRALGDPKTPTVYSVFLRNRQNNRVEIDIGVCPLNEPPRSYLVVALPKLEKPSVSLISSGDLN